MYNLVALVTIMTPAPIVASETHPSCDDLSLACLQSQLQQFTTIPTSLSPCSVVRQPQYNYCLVPNLKLDIIMAPDAHTTNCHILEIYKHLKR